MSEEFICVPFTESGRVCFTHEGKLYSAWIEEIKSTGDTASLPEIQEATKQLARAYGLVVLAPDDIQELTEIHQGLLGAIAEIDSKPGDWFDRLSKFIRRLRQSQIALNFGQSSGNAPAAIQDTPVTSGMHWEVLPAVNTTDLPD